MSDKNHWIDNGDAYICPKCGYEVCNPHCYPGSRCPACGFKDPKDIPTSDCRVCNDGYPIIVHARTNDPTEKGEFKRREANFCPVCGRYLKTYGEEATDHEQ